MVIAQHVLQQAGLSPAFIETDAAVCAVGRIGTVTVGAGIPDAKNMLFGSCRHITVMIV